MEEKKEMSNGGKILILGISLIVITIACGLTYYFMTNNKDSDNKGKENSESAALFTKDNFPKVDASTATQPLMDSFISNFTKTEIGSIIPDYTKTHEAYVKLIDGNADLIIVTEPSEEELTYAKSKNVELEVIPVVNEGFVFFVNNGNKVDSLTLDQIRDVYSGKTTNWKTFGGTDTTIKAYQRPVNSGSQTGMLSLVMKDTKMKEALTEEIIATMAGILDIVSEYKNGEASIGYSYYYYVTSMHALDTIKLLGVNGIVPSDTTIKDKTYPITTSYYIVINKNASESSNARKLANAMLSSRGQSVAKEAGYVPVK